MRVPPQLGAEEVRVFAAITAEMGQEPWSADVATAYLNSDIKVKIYARVPSFVKFLFIEISELLKLCEMLKKLSRRERRQNSTS